MEQAANFFLSCLNANSPMVAVENPVMHKYAKAIIGRSHDFTLQPYEHGDPYTKRTCFWTKGLPSVRPTNIVDGRYPAVHLASPGKDRWKSRSLTYPGIASALARTWG